MNKDTKITFRDENGNKYVIIDTENIDAQLYFNEELLKKQEEIEKQLLELERQEIARASIDNNGKIILVDNLITAIEVANTMAQKRNLKHMTNSKKD